MKESNKFIKHLEELEAATVFHPVDLDTPEGQELVKEYVVEHGAGNKPEAAGSFNEFLEAKFKEDYEGKIVVAEITGRNYGLGHSELAESEVDFKYGDDLRDIDISGCDFTGTQFTGVKLFSLHNVSLRDCAFEGVLMNFVDASGMDLRGSTMEECSFVGEYEDSEIQEALLPFADPQRAQELGVFELYSSRKFAKLKDAEFAKLDAEAEAKKQEKIYQAEKKRKGWVEWSTGGRHGRGEFSLEDYTEEGRQQIKKIEDDYKYFKAKALNKLKRQCKIRLQKPDCDPTYTPNQTPEQASAKRIYIPVTKEDLEEYKKSNTKKSFNEVVAEMYKEMAPGTDPTAVIIADFGGADLSGMDLHSLDLNGVNCAYCKMEGCYLKGANLRGACLEGSTFDSKTSFQEANLVDANMVGASGEGVNFHKAVMIRTRMQCARLPKAKMEHAQMYAVNGTRADLSHSDMQHVDARKAKLGGAIMQSVDARHAKMQGANLTKAVIRRADFEKANLDGAVMTRIIGEGANLKGATMRNVHAELANFRKAILEEIVANGGNFTGADFEEVQAKKAELTGAILEGANAQMADFSEARLEDVKAARANFTRACLEDVKAARIDLRDAAMTRVRAAGADFSKASMQRVEAWKADFTDAVMSHAHLEEANFTAASLKRAALDHAKAKGTKFIATDLGGADVRYIEINDTTLLLDANLRETIGAEALIKLQEQQHKLKTQWFGRSRYGYCEPNADKTNDRFKCQRLGGAVLSAAIGAGAEFAAGGPFGGMGGAAVGAFVGVRALEAIQQGYYEDLGYINNQLGDKLAEIGAIAMATGIGAADHAIDGAAAGLVCASAGAVTGAVTTVAGGAAIAGGAGLLWSGYTKQSRIRKIAGGILTGVGAVTAYVGLSTLSASITTVGYGVAIGAAYGATTALVSNAKRLWNYKDGADGTYEGARPEDIYRESLIRGQKVLRKIIPTVQKLAIGLALAVAFAATAYLLGTTVLPVWGLAKLFAVGNAMITAGTAGFLGGYLYNEKIIAATKYVGRKIAPAALHAKMGLKEKAEAGVEVKVEERIRRVAERKESVKEEEPVVTNTPEAKVEDEIVVPHEQPHKKPKKFVDKHPKKSTNKTHKKEPKVPEKTKKAKKEKPKKKTLKFEKGPDSHTEQVDKQQKDSPTEQDIAG